MSKIATLGWPLANFGQTSDYRYQPNNTDWYEQTANNNTA